jgi:hypothetical protein
MGHKALTNIKPIYSDRLISMIEFITSAEEKGLVSSKDANLLIKEAIKLDTRNFIQEEIKSFSRKRSRQRFNFIQLDYIKNTLLNV